MYCDVCGLVDEHYDENSDVFHDNTPKHICNLILANYKEQKKYFSKNRDGVQIFCDASSEDFDDEAGMKVVKCDHHKIRLYGKPMQKVKFVFSIINDMKKEDLLVVGIQLAHPQPQFIMTDHPYVFGGEPQILKKKSSLRNKIIINFEAVDIGQYEMPIMFTFYRELDKKNIIFVREMVVMVQEETAHNAYTKSPFTSKHWKKADHLISSTSLLPRENKYKIPPLLKILLPRGLEDNALENIGEVPDEIRQKLRNVLIYTRSIFDEGITKDNYMIYFHHLLWWEEIIAKINLRKYNMTGVTMLKKGDVYLLEVPGLAEKRPSVLRGDRVYLRPSDNTEVIFESVVKQIEDNYVHLAELDQSFSRYYSPETLLDVRFLMSRVPMERAHEAVSRVFSSKQDCRLFPEPNQKKATPKLIIRFYNSLISRNDEQRTAVEYIVSGTSGRAPYIVFGPPGTGKTMTIVEAIIQIIVRHPRHKVLVCTDSNMAADHIAVMLLQYNKQLNINNFLLRANSQSREWSVLPPVLAPVSNGTSFENFYSVSNSHVAMYRIVVTTLLHAEKYAMARNQSIHKVQMTHLFIDEAAQASEPNTLVPITGLLSPNGQLVLAGDPRQLGPVCISKEAKHRGLGVSLMERLKLTYDNLYHNDPNYITMLVKNFRSDPDILQIPNELFYNNELEALAAPDPISKKSILGLPGGERALVFHAVNSREQKMGNAPSYYNEKELDMLKRYVKSLIDYHKVLQEDIGIIAPYIRQVYKMKSWLTSEKYEKIEIGTVEAFQGKEKRVILVSTVRANCRLLDFDAKYGLGFLVDDKRYNVTITRAKAKLIIIGNPTCLTRDIKWRKYMGLCKDFESYFGVESEQLGRTSSLLVEVARTRFDKCRLSEELKAAQAKAKKK